MHQETFENISIVRTTKGKSPDLPFVRIKTEILGKKYKLSLAFVNKKTIENLSLKFKGDKTHKNILSFPLEENLGEIVINLQTVRIQAKDFEMSYHQYLVFLFIHGCLHLKGFDHGEEMENLEEKYMKKFSTFF